jgi:hypothetical protein
MAVASEWRIASAPARSQGSARCARRLLPPLTATGAPAHTVVRQLLTQLLRSATTGFRNTKFLTTPFPEEFVREWRASNAASLRTAGPANNIPAGAVHSTDSADPKPLQLSGPPPFRMRGEAEKLPSASAEQASEPSNLLDSVN